MIAANPSSTTGRVRRTYTAVVRVAWLWAIVNAVYVYMVLGGARTFRLEAAAFILTAVLLPLTFRRHTTDERAGTLEPASAHLLIALAVVLWVAAVGPFLRLPFLADDYVFLASYRHLPDVLVARQFFRPMFALVFFLLAKIGHGSVVPFHLAAFGIHVGAACCVYVFTRRLFGRADSAALCFAVFLLNPLQAEAVLWPSGLQELLWTICILCAFVVYTGRASLSLGRLLATIALIGCALLAKETAISFVLLLPAADWAFYRMKRDRALAPVYGFFGLLAGAYLLVRGWFGSIEPEFFVVPGRYFVQKFLATPYRFFVQPWNVTAVHMPMIVMCAVTIIALTLISRAVIVGAGPMLLVGPAVIVISTLPLYSYFYVGPDLRAARYLYFAAIGWAVLVAQVMTSAFQRRRGFAVASASVLVVAFVSLHVNERPWASAGEIVHALATAAADGGTGEPTPAEWRKQYGDGFEFKDGIPTVYRGVYVFINGYPELREMAARGDLRP